jgi:hypothetical protein
MAPGALRVDFRRLARYQAVRSILVDGVAGRATHLIFGMTAIDASDMSGLILMAGEADAIGFGGLQFGGLFDIGCGPAIRRACCPARGRTRRLWYPSRVSYRFPLPGEGSSERR